MYGYDADWSFLCHHAHLNVLRKLSGMTPLEENDNLLLACRRSKSSHKTVARLKQALGLRCLDNWRGPSHKGGLKGNRKGTGTIQTGMVPIDDSYRRKRQNYHEIAKVWTPEVCVALIDKAFGTMHTLTVQDLLTIKDYTRGERKLFCVQQVLQPLCTHLGVNYNVPDRLGAPAMREAIVAALNQRREKSRKKARLH